MGRTPLKKRRKKPSTIFKTKIESSLIKIGSDFLKSDSFKHAQTKGSEREKPIQDFFNENLPDIFKVVKGEAVDLYDKHSPQLDLMIYDCHRNYAFFSGENYILPAEALLVSIEIKTLLTKNEIEKSLIAANKLMKLKPFRKPLCIKRTGGISTKGECRYYHSIFCYSTDLSKKNWLKSEYDRIINISKNLKISTNIIRRIYVVNHGYINLDSKMGTEENNSPLGLMSLYMDIFNFIMRENRRREDVPYIDYAGGLSLGLDKIK